MRGGTLVTASLAILAMTACLTGHVEPDGQAKTTQRGTGGELCVPGQSITCQGPGRCVGYQICADDGARYEPCICDPNDVFLAWDALCKVDGVPAPASTADLQTKLAGRWWYCGGDGPFRGAVELAVESGVITSDHYYLLALEDGVLRRRTDLDSSGMFYLEDSGSDQFRFTYVTAHGLDKETGYAGKLEEANPAKMSLDGATFVRIP